MAITINHPSTRVDPPSVTLNGKQVTSGEYANTAADVSATTEVSNRDGDSSLIQKQDVILFWGDVTVTLTPDTTWTAASYNEANQDREFVGKKNTGSSREVNAQSETYWSVDGKDPVRGRSSLYTGPFTLRRNLSGIDNIVLKARTYCNGLKSEVTKVEFRIGRNASSRSV
jgi:hypothetical protein